MAASSKPPSSIQVSSGNGNGNGSISNGGTSVPDNLAAVGPTQAALRHNPGISIEWTADEQSLLEDFLIQYPSDMNLVRYAKIASQLRDKTVRDVALRCRWMTKKENGKRRKEDQNSARKNKEKKERVADPLAKPSYVTTHATGVLYSQPPVSMDNDDGISYKAIGGEIGQLLEQNAQTLEQISANFAVSKVLDNINHLCQAHNNILTIMNSMNDIPDTMKQMPPLPVNPNSVIPLTSLWRR